MVCRNCEKENNIVVNDLYQKKQSKEILDDKKKAEKLCLISLLVFFGPFIISGILYSIIDNLSLNIISSITILCPLVGIILMIVSRVKYPNNKMAKTLMLVYIILVVTGLIFLAFAFIFCEYFVSTFCPKGSY